MFSTCISGVLTSALRQLFLEITTESVLALFIFFSPLFEVLSSWFPRLSSPLSVFPPSIYFTGTKTPLFYLRQVGASCELCMSGLARLLKICFLKQLSFNTFDSLVWSRSRKKVCFRSLHWHLKKCQRENSSLFTAHASLKDVRLKLYCLVTLWNELFQTSQPSQVMMNCL